MLRNMQLNLNGQSLHAGTITFGSGVVQAPNGLTQRVTVSSSKGSEQRDSQSPSIQPDNDVLIERLSKLQEQTSMLFHHQQVVEFRVEGDVNPRIFGLHCARTLTKKFAEPRVKGGVLVEYYTDPFGQKLFEEFLQDGHHSVIGEDDRRAILALFEERGDEEPFPSWTLIDGGKSGIDSTVQDHVTTSILKSIFPELAAYKNDCNVSMTLQFGGPRRPVEVSFSEACEKMQEIMEMAVCQNEWGQLEVDVFHPSNDQLTLAIVIIEAESDMNERASVLRHIEAIMEQEVRKNKWTGRKLLRGLSEWGEDKKMGKSYLIRDSDGRDDFYELQRILTKYYQ
jgi:hypothetical protein